MIAQLFRFRGHNAVSRLYGNSRTLRSSMLSLKYAQRSGVHGQRPYQAAIVVSRKVHKSAVVRNRIRRRIYELIRQFDAEALRGYQLVIVVYSDQVALLDAARLRSIVFDVLSRATSNIPNGQAHAIVKPVKTDRKR